MTYGAQIAPETAPAKVLKYLQGLDKPPARAKIVADCDYVSSGALGCALAALVKYGYLARPLCECCGAIVYALTDEGRAWSE